MQIILIQDVDNLGAAGELVTVKNGYARNFLIPQKFAIEASSSNLKKLNEQNKVKAKREASMLAEINKVIAKLSEGPLRIGAKTGTTGKIFGSVTPLQISRAIRDQKGYDIDRRHIQILSEIKELGLYKATIDFGNEHTTEVEFEVVSE